MRRKIVELVVVVVVANVVANVVADGVNTFLTKLIQLSCLPRMKYFGLPNSVT